jgi:hypothetical protein
LFVNDIGCCIQLILDFDSWAAENGSTDLLTNFSDVWRGQRSIRGESEVVDSTMDVRRGNKNVEIDGTVTTPYTRHECEYLMATKRY